MALKKCQQCGGTGKVLVPTVDALGNVYRRALVVVCGVCMGKGQVHHDED